ncbi:zona pellucida-binding protein 1 [Lissotriton helveticus]
MDPEGTRPIIPPFLWLVQRRRRSKRRLLLFLLLLALPAGQSFLNFESTEEPYSLTSVQIETLQVDDTTQPTSAKVVGLSNQPAKVYVKLNHNTPHVLCLTQRLRDAELTDPQYQWRGPSGQNLPDSSNVVITPTGTLIVRHFKEEMSGTYTCTLHYSTAVKQYEKKFTLKYIIYAYTEPNFYYEFSVRYHAAPCQSAYNMSFEKKLLELLKKLIAELTCEIILLKAECHHIKMQRAGLQNEVFFLFSVFALDSPDEVICSSNCAAMDRLNKAKELIEAFFEKQSESLEESKVLLPDIYYIAGTLHMIWVNRCFPGYGMDPKFHPGCPNCCVICSPGTYNPQDGVHCLACNTSAIYGAKKCL